VQTNKMDPTREREMEMVAIERAPLRVEDVVPARYIRLDYTVLLSRVESMTPQNIIITSICWTLKWRPIEVKILENALTPEMENRIRLARESPTSDQAIAFLVMVGLMTLTKEIRLTPPANYEYLKLRWKALCATMRTTNIFEQNKILNEIFMRIIQTLVV